MKKGILVSGALALSVIFGGNAITSHAENMTPTTKVTPLAADLHVADKPVHVYKSEATGVTVSVYASNPGERAALMKEQGWKDGDAPQIVHDRDMVNDHANDHAKDPKNVASIISNTVGKATAGFINAFAPITAHALTSGWDLVGTEYWLMSGDYSKVEVDSIHKSTGGSYMVRVPGIASAGGTTGKITLKEQDPPGNPDEFICSWEYPASMYNQDFKIDGIDHWVNMESDGVAELYTMHQANFWNKGTSDGRINNVQYFD